MLSKRAACLCACVFVFVGACVFVCVCVCVCVRVFLGKPKRIPWVESSDGLLLRGNYKRHLAEEIK